MFVFCVFASLIIRLWRYLLCKLMKSSTFLIKVSINYSIVGWFFNSSPFTFNSVAISFGTLHGWKQYSNHSAYKTILDRRLRVCECGCNMSLPECVAVCSLSARMYWCHSSIFTSSSHYTTAVYWANQLQHEWNRIEFMFTRNLTS